MTFGEPPSQIHNTYLESQEQKCCIYCLPGEQGPQSDRGALGDMFCPEPEGLSDVFVKTAEGWES